MGESIEVDEKKLWHVEPFNPGDMKDPLQDESSFATLFPRYREKYLKDIWPLVTEELNKYGVKCTLDLREGSMSVNTTRRTWDPVAILKARDVIKLLSRSVPVQQALKMFKDDETACDIIKIGNFTRSKERFVKRRQRLLGPNGQTLRALELLSNCYLLVQGNTVAAMGPFKGLREVRNIVEDCMCNVHPIYHIKSLMIKRELAKDPTMKNENWERFLPKFKKQTPPPRPKKKKEKKKYTPFPPPQQPRKEDLAIESGEYFMTAQQEAEKKRQEKKVKQTQKQQDKQHQRQKVFQPPVEKARKVVKEDVVTSDSVSQAVENIKKRGVKRKLSPEGALSDFVSTPLKKPRT